MGKSIQKKLIHATIEKLDLLIDEARSLDHPDILEYREIRRQLVCLDNRLDKVKPIWADLSPEENT